MSEKNLSQEVLEKIQANHLQPKAKWKSALKNYIIWVGSLLFLLLSIASFSSSLHLLINNDWDVYHQISDSLWRFVLLALPYFWLIFLIIFVLLADYNFKHTKGGYKLTLLKIITFSALIIVLGGLFLQRIGLGRLIDRQAAERLPFYHQIINRRLPVWLHSEKGFLAGVILETEEEYFILRDLNNKKWLVYYQNQPLNFPLNEPVRIIGQQIEENVFRVEQIFPSRGLRLKCCQPPLPPEPH